MTTVRVGVSGWSYDEWGEGLYRGVPRARRLERYAELFATVEVNYTFRRLLAPSTARNWVAQTPEGFRFAVKAHQGITHRDPLRPAGDLLSRFLESLHPLGPRLGPVLFQLPPSFSRDDHRLAAFLDELPSRLEAAFEFRHSSWFEPEVLDLLREHGAALAMAEDDRTEAVMAATADFAYGRLRKSSYPDRTLAEWAKRLADLPVREVWAYLKHDGDAPEYARRLQALAG